MESNKVVTIEDEKTKRQIVRLKQVFWTSEFALLSLFLLRFFETSQHINPYLFLVIMALLLPTIYYANKGNFEKGSAVFLLVLTLAVSYLMWINEGLRDESVFAIPAIICFAAMLNQKRLLYWLVSIAFINILAIGAFNYLGWLIHEGGTSSLTTAIMLVTILGVMSYSVKQFADDLAYANKKLAEHKSNLESTVTARTDELEKSFIRLSETKQQLVENEKMASLGKMVAGVAHEINTPVGISVTASSYGYEKIRALEKSVTDGTLKKSDLLRCIEETKNSYKIIDTNLYRAADLIENFKQVAVEQTSSQRSTFNLNQYLQEIINSLSPKIREQNVNVVQNYDPDIVLYASKGAIAQVITNFVVNSLVHGLDGMPEPSIRLTTRKQGDSVLLEYTDNGKGMSDEVSKQIFDPFYTTKRGEGSSGLGMHIVYNIVTHTLGGTISCKSEKNKGVCFTLLFPISALENS